jgi:NhaP-type Na+/H+ or K+/H+ antiporter
MISDRDLVILALALLVYAAVSKRLNGTVVSPAIAFLAGGLLLGDAGLGLLVLDAESDTMRLLAEGALALVLFTDASRVDFVGLRREISIPARLLGIGLPLTVAAGTALALTTLAGLTLPEAAILAIAVTPTDAALGQAVVTDERVPRPLRQGLNVESGLNDGLCVPLLVIALAFAGAEAGEVANPVLLVVEEIGFGVVGGVAAGAAAALLLRAAVARGWVGRLWRPVVPVASTGLAYGLATMLGGSGLIAAFVAGLTFGTVSGRAADETEEVEEVVGVVLSALTFAVFGAVVAPLAFDSIGAGSVLFALGALTVGRMLPVAIALLGSGARVPTVLFAGWFGPRGLASIVFAVLILQAEIGGGVDLVLDTIALTVLLSVILHGVTAPPLTARYAGWIAKHPAAATTPAGAGTVHAGPE